MQRIIKSGKIKKWKDSWNLKYYTARLEVDEVNDIFLLITETSVEIVDFKQGKHLKELNRYLKIKNCFAVTNIKTGVKMSLKKDSEQIKRYFHSS